MRASNLDPLANGLSFLVHSKPKDIAYAAGKKVETFEKFCIAFANRWKEDDAT